MSDHYTLTKCVAIQKNCRALCIMWHKAHVRNPTTEELQVYFRVKSPNNKTRTYYPYNIRGKMLKKEI